MTHLPFVQTPVTQSFFVLHVMSIAHLLQNAPPQSMSDSSPFWIMSLHVGAAPSTLASDLPPCPPEPGPVVLLDPPVSPGANPP
jgi:hypothetical protein